MKERKKECTRSVYVAVCAGWRQQIRHKNASFYCCAQTFFLPCPVVSALFFYCCSISIQYGARTTQLMHNMNIEHNIELSAMRNVWGLEKEWQFYNNKRRYRIEIDIVVVAVAAFYSLFYVVVVGAAVLFTYRRSIDDISGEYDSFSISLRNVVYWMNLLNICDWHIVFSLASNLPFSGNAIQHTTSNMHTQRHRLSPSLRMATV